MFLKIYISKSCLEAQILITQSTFPTVSGYIPAAKGINKSFIVVFYFTAAASSAPGASLSLE